MDTTGTSLACHRPSPDCNQKWGSLYWNLRSHCSAEVRSSLEVAACSTVAAMSHNSTLCRIVTVPFAIRTLLEDDPPFVPRARGNCKGISDTRTEGRTAAGSSRETQPVDGWRPEGLWLIFSSEIFYYTLMKNCCILYYKLLSSTHQVANNYSFSAQFGTFHRILSEDRSCSFSLCFRHYWMLLRCSVFIRMDLIFKLVYILNYNLFIFGIPLIFIHTHWSIIVEVCASWLHFTSEYLFQ